MFDFNFGQYGRCKNYGKNAKAFCSTFLGLSAHYEGQMRFLGEDAFKLTLYLSGVNPASKVMPFMVCIRPIF